MPSLQPGSVEVIFQTWEQPPQLRGEEFLMQWLAGWDMIQSFNNVWQKKIKTQKTTHPHLKKKKRKQKECPRRTKRLHAPNL